MKTKTKKMQASQKQVAQNVETFLEPRLNLTVIVKHAPNGEELILIKNGYTKIVWFPKGN